jgi:hypothetical protein
MYFVTFFGSCLGVAFGTTMKTHYVVLNKILNTCFSIYFKNYYTDHTHSSKVLDLLWAPIEKRFFVLAHYCALAHFR